MVRLTKKNREKLLDLNDGFKTKTSYSGKNSCEDRSYRIENGQLHIKAIGKSSWSDSRYDDEWVADEKETHRFLYNNLGQLDKNISENKTQSLQKSNQLNEVEEENYYYEESPADVYNETDDTVEESFTYNIMKAVVEGVIEGVQEALEDDEVRENLKQRGKSFIGKIGNKVGFRKSKK